MLLAAMTSFAFDPKHLIDTFFEGSPEKVVEALVGREGPGLSEDALDRIAQLIDRARREGRRK